MLIRFHQQYSLSSRLVVVAETPRPATIYYYYARCFIKALPRENNMEELLAYSSSRKNRLVFLAMAVFVELFHEI